MPCVRGTDVLCPVCIHRERPNSTIHCCDAVQARFFYMTEAGYHVWVDHLDWMHQDCKLTIIDPAPEPQPDPDPVPEALAPNATATHDGNDFAAATAGAGGAGAATGASGVIGDEVAAAAAGVLAGTGAVSDAEDRGLGGNWGAFAAGRDDTAVDSDRVTSLRAELEWGDEARAAAESGDGEPVAPDATSSKHELYSMTNAQGLVSLAQGQGQDRAPPPVIRILVEPGGVRAVPNGATARDIVKEYGKIELSGGPEGGLPGVSYVNVNNELVPEDTLLRSGDLIVLSNHVLADV